ncbi:MAG: NAD+ synthase [Phycisphaerales bacterium]|nr:NAD+ synthase [Phycisphaerales bacterium]
MRLALVQFNPVVGDARGNAQRITDFIRRAAKGGVEAVVFPELAVCGYPPKDLLLADGFVRACGAAAREAGLTAPAGITVVLGVPLVKGLEPGAAGAVEGGVTNSLLAFRDGAVLARYDKRLLPTYDVFDEDRYFDPGDSACVLGDPAHHGGRAGLPLGLAICEDLWKGQDAGFAGRYLTGPDPAADLVAAGARVFLVPSASPFVLGKGALHRQILRAQARRHRVFVASVNQVGGNDDLVFDGHAAVYDPSGRLIAAGAGFEEGIVIAEVRDGAPEVADPLLAAPSEEVLFRALALGTRDYLRKTGHSKAIIGLSGGIDSAVTAAIAVAAIGAAGVTGVSMPGPYSSGHSRDDAYDLARRLGIGCITIPIGAPVRGFRESLDPAFTGHGLAALGAAQPDVCEQNLQSRARGTTLMALSNRTGAVVLTTGNKSELAVGYTTLYGDMNGGLAVLCDVPKMQVYDLARWMNQNPAACGFTAPPIPQSSIDKPPSAELAPDQTDQDTLPPYDVLDLVIERYVERRQSPGTIARETGIDPALVARIGRMIDGAEFKRKQLATGLKVTSVAFGPGRRMPIAQRWRW